MENTGTAIICILDSLAGRCDSFAGYAVYSYVRVRRQVAEAMWLRENLWICDEVKSPFILGLHKPKIYLSSSMDEAQYPYVIAHEQAHLKRGDQWWKPLGFLILAIHWFNPLSGQRTSCSAAIWNWHAMRAR